MKMFFLSSLEKSCNFALSNTPKPARVRGGRQDILKRRCNSVLSAALLNFATSLGTVITQCSTSMVVCSLYAIYVTRGLRHCLFCTKGQCEGLTERDKQSSRFPRFFFIYPITQTQHQWRSRNHRHQIVAPDTDKGYLYDYSIQL